MCKDPLPPPENALGNFFSFKNVSKSFSRQGDPPQFGQKKGCFFLGRLTLIKMTYLIDMRAWLIICCCMVMVLFSLSVEIKQFTEVCTLSNNFVCFCLHMWTPRDFYVFLELIQPMVVSEKVS